MPILHGVGGFMSNSPSSFTQDQATSPNAHVHLAGQWFLWLVVLRKAPVGVGGAVESYGHERLRLRRPPEEPPLCDEKDDDDEGDESLLLLSAASFPRAESKVAAADSAAHAGAAKGRNDGKPGARDDEDYSDDDFG